MSEMIFSNSEWLRYTRHIQLPQIGVQGQKRLKQAKVLIVGAGGLGAPVSLYLAAAGVGHITIIDNDTVDLTNLQRQIIFSTEQVGQPKALCAEQRLRALNTDIKVNSIQALLTVDNANPLIKSADLVLDCTDNFATRYLINDLCVKHKKPWLFASIHQFSGQCALFTPETACFRCVFPEAPKNIADCNTAGVLGVLPGLLGLFQANEAVKYLVGLECPLKNQLLIIEALDLSFRKIQLAKNPECQACGDGDDTQIQDSDYNLACEAGELNTYELSAQQFNQLRDQDNIQLLDVRTDAERQAFHIGGQHIVLDQLESQVDALDGKKHYLCYCQSGIRSQKAAVFLRDKGIVADSLSGGLGHYLKAIL